MKLRPDRRAASVRVLELALALFEVAFSNPDATVGATGPDAKAIRWAAEVRTDLRRFAVKSPQPLAQRQEEERVH